MYISNILFSTIEMNIWGPKYLFIFKMNLFFAELVRCNIELCYTMIFYCTDQIQNTQVAVKIEEL